MTIILTLAINQKFVTSYDNYFIILVIAIVSFSPEVRYIEKDDYKVSKLEGKLFVRALIGLFAWASFDGVSQKNVAHHSLHFNINISFKRVALCEFIGVTRF